MKYKKILDLHTHTDNSFDGNHSVMYMCEKAVESELRAIAFTDHIEIDLYHRDRFDRTALQSYYEIMKARSAFRGRLLVCAGVELGQPMYDLPVAQALTAKMAYDVVIASVHNLRGMLDFWYLDYSQYDTDKLLDEYFRELALMAEWGGFDVFAHLTYPLRYICGEHEIPVDLSRRSDEIDAILRTLAEKGKALEINTSGLRQKLGKTMPEESIVRRFKELGGEYITLGSDAHYAEHIGAGICEGMDIAKRCGFDYVTLFQQREAIPIPIE